MIFNQSLRNHFYFFFIQNTLELNKHSNLSQINTFLEKEKKKFFKEVPTLTSRLSIYNYLYLVFFIIDY